MNWDKINIKEVMKFLRRLEKVGTPTLFGEYAVVYSDGKEELKISYRTLEC